MKQFVFSYYLEPVFPGDKFQGTAYSGYTPYFDRYSKITTYGNGHTSLHLTPIDTSGDCKSYRTYDSPIRKSNGIKRFYA